jgi:hypothetical protein
LTALRTAAEVDNSVAADERLTRGAVVVALAADGCWVQPDAVHCAQCNCGQRWSAAEPATFIGTPHLRPAGARPRPGARVQLTIMRRPLTQAVVALFGAPVLGLVIGAMIGTAWHGPQVGLLQALWALSGTLVAAIVVGVWFKRRPGTLAALQIDAICDNEVVTVSGRDAPTGLGSTTWSNGS